MFIFSVEFLYSLETPYLLFGHSKLYYCCFHFLLFVLEDQYKLHYLLCFVIVNCWQPCLLLVLPHWSFLLTALYILRMQRCYQSSPFIRWHCFLTNALPFLAFFILHDVSHTCGILFPTPLFPLCHNWFFVLKNFLLFIPFFFSYLRCYLQFWMQNPTFLLSCPRSLQFLQYFGKMSYWIFTSSILSSFVIGFTISNSTTLRKLDIRSTYNFTLAQLSLVLLMVDISKWIGLTTVVARENRDSLTK